MIYLVLLNTLAIIYILFVKDKYYISIDKNKSTYKKVLLGYRVYLMEKTSQYSASSVYSIYFPLRNSNKIELREEIEDLMTSCNKHYNLRANFSWLKSWDKVQDFQKKYSVVDKEFVDELVETFKEKNNVVEK